MKAQAQVIKTLRMPNILATIPLALTILSIPLWVNFSSPIKAEDNLGKRKHATSQVKPTPTPTKVISAGVKWHGAEAWHPTYEGQGVKIGVIDSGFEGFSNLGVDLPESANLGYHCYDSLGDVVSGVIPIKNIHRYQNDLNHCNGMYDEDQKQNPENHGTIVAQIVTDVAPKATLYIANPSAGPKTQSTVEWMLQQGVDIINYSALDEPNAPGNGTSGFSSTTPTPLNTVNIAVGTPTPRNAPTPESTPARSLWVNAGGNQAKLTWYGAYHNPNESQESATNPHDLSFLSSSNQEGNDITLQPGENIAVFLRWDDHWGTSPGTSTGARCNLDLFLYKKTSTGQLESDPEAKSVRIQSGRANDNPFEVFAFAVPTNLPPSSSTYTIVINATNECPQSVHRPDWIQLQVGNTSGPLEYATDDGNFAASGPDYFQIGVPPESNNPGMLSVGSAEENSNAPNNLIVSPHSNRGPTMDGRIKPDVLGFNCGLIITNVAKPATATQPATNNVVDDVCGSSVAAPHVAGLAALMIQRYSLYQDNPVTLANHIRWGAVQYGTPDPNNNWGRGFAYLPHPSGFARLTRAGSSLGPSTIYKYNSPRPRNFHGQFFNLQTNIGSPPAVKIKVGPELSLNLQCGSGKKTSGIYDDGDTLSIRGCTTTTYTRIQIYEGETLLSTRSVNVAQLPTVSIRSMPSSIPAKTSKLLRVSATNLPSSDQVQIKVSSHLAVQGNCSATGNRQANVAGGNQFTLYACSTGPATVTLYSLATGVQLNSYSVTVSVAATNVPTPTPMPVPMPGSPNPPTNLRLSKVADNNQKLQLTYTEGGSPNRYQFQLYYLDKFTGNDRFFASENDSRSPETFSDVGRGYQYRARGRNCQTHHNRATCSAWSAWSNYVTLSNPQISITRLSPTIVNGKSDWFTVQGSDLTYDEAQTITLTSNHTSIGFNRSCVNTDSSSFTPIHDQWVGFFLYTCGTPGGTITAQLRKGSATGTTLDTATATISVTKGTASLSPLPTTAFTVGHDRTFTLTTDVPRNPGIWINVGSSNDTGGLTLPPTRGCHQAQSGIGAANRNSITIRGCKAGTATISLHHRTSGDTLATYQVNVNDSNTDLSPTPGTFTVGNDQTFTVNTDIPNTAGLWITATIASDPGRITLLPNHGCHKTSSGISAVNGNTITIRSCEAGNATITIYRRNSSVFLKSYTVTVNASSTSLSPTPGTFTIGANQTFTLNTSIADNPGTWIYLHETGDTGRVVLDGQSCMTNSIGKAAVNGNSITLKPCTAGSVTIKVNRSNSSVTLVTYKVTVNTS